MNKKISIVLAAIAVTILLTSCASSVKFKSLSGRDLTLSGTLYKPDGNGPFPAVVLFPRCNGVCEWDHSWASRLKSWGYAALIVDRFGPRNIVDACKGQDPIGSVDRIKDAHSAKSYLAGLPFIDSKRIAVMGWSYGGGDVLFAVDPNLWGILRSNEATSLSPANTDPFRAAIAFYPYCHRRLENLNAPLLVLIGEKDNWKPGMAEYCTRNIPTEGKSRYETIVKVYPGVYHCFDCSGVKLAGRYDHGATSDSIEQVRNFLYKHMK